MRLACLEDLAGKTSDFDEGSKDTRQEFPLLQENFLRNFPPSSIDACERYTNALDLLELSFFWRSFLVKYFLLEHEKGTKGNAIHVGLIRTKVCNGARKQILLFLLSK